MQWNLLVQKKTLCLIQYRLSEVRFAVFGGCVRMKISPAILLVIFLC